MTPWERFVAERRLLPESLNIKMVTARGPLAVASSPLGVTDLLIALKTEPEKGHRLLEMLPRIIITRVVQQSQPLN